MVVQGDNGYKKFLATEFTPSGVGVTTLSDADKKDLVLVVDTATWYVYYNGEWYPQ